MKRVGLALTVVFFAGLAMLAACSGTADDSTDSPTGAASGEFDGTIRLGTPLSETGKFAVEGKDTRQGYDT